MYPKKCGKNPDRSCARRPADPVAIHTLPRRANVAGTLIAVITMCGRRALAAHADVGHRGRIVRRLITGRVEQERPLVAHRAVVPAFQPV